MKMERALAKRHYKVLTMIVSCPECFLLNIFRLNSNMKIPRFQLNFGIYHNTSQLIHKMINPWERVFVLDSDLFKLTIIHMQPHIVILFLD